MIEYVFWVFSFISLFVTLVWLQLYFIEEPKKHLKQIYPSVTIAVPVFNEEKTLKKTIESLQGVIYPKKKLQIIIVNDGSKDNTKQIAEKLAKQYKNVILINQKNQGKGKALNTALKYAKGELFSCVDADSYVSPSSIKLIVNYFEEPKLGAVISFTKVHNPKTFLEKLQWIEYTFTAFIRNLMTKINTLYTTPGVLSMYRTKTIKNLGGFDEDNLTEDLEIAMRLQYNHYLIKMETESKVYTKVPKTFMQLWRQRVRWYRGLLHNLKKYRKMIFSREHELMGLFQLPLILLTIFMIVTGVVVLLYKLTTSLYNHLSVIWLLKEDYFVILKNIEIGKTILGFNLKFYIPIIIVLLLITYMFQKAYKQAKTNTRYPLVFIFYLLIYPMINTLHWLSALFNEVTKRKKKW